MKFDYFSSYCTDDHMSSVLNELKKAITDNEDDIDNFFEILAKSLAFTNIMSDFYFEKNMSKYGEMAKHCSELRDLQRRVVEDIKANQNEINMYSLSEFIDREIERVEKRKRRNEVKL